MKRTICLLLCLIFFATSFSGCSKQNVQEIAPVYTQPPIPDFIYDLADSFPEAPPEQLPDKVFADNEVYTLYREDGTCYLSFKSGNYKIHFVLEEKESAPFIGLVFDSMHEKYQWLCSPVITKDVELEIRSTLPLDKNMGFIFPDPEQLYIVHIPEKFDVNLTDLTNHCVYTSRKGFNNGKSTYCTMSVISKDAFTDLLANYYRFDYRDFVFEVTRSEENGSTIYEYENNGYKQRIELSCIQTKNRTIYIEKGYIDNIEHPNDYGYHLCDVNIFGYDNGRFFTLRPHHQVFEPFLELLDEVTIVKYPF